MQEIWVYILARVLGILGGFLRSASDKPVPILNCLPLGNLQTSTQNPFIFTFTGKVSDNFRFHLRKNMCKTLFYILQDTVYLEFFSISRIHMAMLTQVVDLRIG